MQVESAERAPRRRLRDAAVQWSPVVAAAFGDQTDEGVGREDGPQGADRNLGQVEPLPMGDWTPRCRVERIRHVSPTVWLIFYPIALGWCVAAAQWRRCRAIRLARNGGVSENFGLQPGMGTKTERLYRDSKVLRGIFGYFNSGHRVCFYDDRAARRG